MLPGDGRNVFQQMTGDGRALALQRIDDAGEVDGIPVNDRTDHEIEAGGAKGLAVEGAVADLAALAVDEPYALKLSGASAVGELLELKIERPPHRVEPGRRISRHAKAQSIGVLLLCEGARRHQIFVERAISAAPLHPDVAGAEPIAKGA